MIFLPIFPSYFSFTYICILCLIWNVVGLRQYTCYRIFFIWVDTRLPNLIYCIIHPIWMSILSYNKFLPVCSLFLFLLPFCFIVSAVSLCLYIVSHFSDNPRFINMLISGKASFPSLIFMFWFSPFSYFVWFYYFETIPTLQFSSITQLCLNLCDPMDCSTPGLPVNCQHLEFTQTHVHWAGDAIQQSHPLLSPSPPCLQSFPASRAFQISQFFISDGQRIRVSALASVLPMNTQA